MPKEDKILEDYDRLKAAYSTALKNREYIRQALGDERMNRILQRFEKEIESTKESLVLAEKKEIDSKQQAVIARRSLLAQLRGAYEEDVRTAKEDLDRFERDNQLFLQDQKPSRKKKDEEAVAV